MKLSLIVLLMSLSLSAVAFDQIGGTLVDSKNGSSLTVSCSQRNSENNCVKAVAHIEVHTTDDLDETREDFEFKKEEEFTFDSSTVATMKQKSIDNKIRILEVNYLNDSDSDLIAVTAAKAAALYPAYKVNIAKAPKIISELVSFIFSSSNIGKKKATSAENIISIHRGLTEILLGL